MLIEELLTTRRAKCILSTPPETSLLRMAALLREHDKGALLVIDDAGSQRGLVSERDFMRAFDKYQGKVSDLTVADIMSRSVITCEPSDDIVETLMLMNEQRIRHVPVVKDGALEAVISIRAFEHACRRLQRQAGTDDLSGLANRRSFLDMMRKELGRFSRYQTAAAVAMLDIDRFKRINDTFGHAIGDRVICALGDMLAEELRAIDTVARLGGDEFAIIFSHTSIENAALACERLVAAVEAVEIKTAEGPVRFSVSIGLTAITAQDSTPESVLKRADQQLYQAKQSGRKLQLAGRAGARAALV